VRIAPDIDSDRSPQVRIDDFRAARELTEHLVGLGHREIGFIKGDPGHAAGRLRLEGFRSGMRAHALTVREEWIEQGLFSYASGVECARRLLRNDRRPSAIMASNDDMAAGVIAVAHALNIGVPEQLSVVGFDDAPIAQVVWPALTTVRQPIGLMADVAAEILLARVVAKAGTGWPHPMPRRELDYELMLRASTAAMAAPANA
jgi:LacI family transcriptional regulator